MLREIVSVSAENDKKKFKFFQSKMERRKRRRKKHPKEDGKSLGFSFDKNILNTINFILYFNFNLKSRLMDLMEQFKE